MNTLADQLAEVSVPGDAQHFSPDVLNSTIKHLHIYRFALSQFFLYKETVYGTTLLLQLLYKGE